MDTSGASGDGRRAGHDPRSWRTERALRRALVDLAAESGSAAVTAKELAGRAGIGRATFYRHHESVQAFVDSLRAGLIAELRSAFLDIGLDPGTKPGTYDVLACRARAVLLVAAHDVDLFRLMWEGNAGTAFRDRFRAELAVLFDGDLRRIGARTDAAYCPPEYLSAYATHAITGVLGAWLAKDEREPIEDVTFYLVTLINSGSQVLEQ
ncbi:TetR/AcrR family transcriptional regulator [Streptomyces sp. NRRL B-3229]|uniref:TetR/AcrR family transcriptional regulator n=1 Tax=Streptomyces sp. NRRL B-3229 TaxID=1463836 RepID=UPI0004BE86A3|nr:TetR/AcrR family transcriptional regulator [Streptomyces sp. NRRL B-3229]